MTRRAQRAALAAGLLSLATALAACGSGSSPASSERPAHRPISVVYVAGDEQGPWGARTQGLADGVKLAIAERDGLIGERAVSIAVVPTEQRDGNTVSAAIGTGRILRDSRTLAVLGTYSAPQLGLAAPQLNGGEITLLQFGSGMQGLIAAEQPGEPDRYEPSGVRFAVRGVAGDEAIAQALAARRELRGAQVVAVTGAYDRGLEAAARSSLAEAQRRRDRAIERGSDDPPPTDPALTAPTPEVPDALRIANQIARAVDGKVTRGAAEATAARGSAPRIVVIDPTEPTPSAATNAALVGATGPVAVVDGADRPIAARATRNASRAFTVRRRLADPSTPRAREIRARAREAFGRDRGDATVAGYLAARRLLKLAAEQPERTIDRVDYAAALTAAAPEDPDFPVDEAGDALLPSLSLLQRSGDDWRPLG